MFLAKIIILFGAFKYYAHICSAQHLNQATMFANRLPLAFFVPIGYLYSSDPRVECLMASQPDSGVEQRESGTFFVYKFFRFFGEGSLSRL
jgi:hypothetical protein